MTPCRFVTSYQRFEVIDCFHPQDKVIIAIDVERYLKTLESLSAQ